MDRVSKAERELVRKMQQQTNADRIRSMTDEELAEWFGTHACCVHDPFFCTKPGGCKKCWLKWLKRGVDNG